MNCFACAPSLNSVPWYTYSNLDEKERKFDTDGRDCEERRIEFFFFFRCGTISLEEKSFYEMEYLNLMKSFCIKDFIKDCIKDLLFLYSFFILDDASM